MNTSHITDWARKSGINIYIGDDLPTINDEVVKVLKKFAQYSANYERQLCARICERQAKDEDEHQVWTDCAEFLAKRIRSRGQS
jgi:hypothetical protein